MSIGDVAVWQGHRSNVIARPGRVEDAPEAVREWMAVAYPGRCRAVKASPDGLRIVALTPGGSVAFGVSVYNGIS